MPRRKKKQKRKLKRCTPCEESVKSGEYIRVCRLTGKKKECKILLNKISSEEITSKQLYKKVRKLVKGKKKLEKKLDEIDKIMEEIADEDED